MLTEDVRAQIRQKLAPMEGPVKLVYFTRKNGRDFCQETRELLEDLSGISDKLSLEVHDFTAEPEAVRQYGITRVPALAIVGDRDRGVRIYGIPAGYEFAALLEAILDAARGSSTLTQETLSAVRSFSRPVHLEVYVTPT